MVYNLEVEKFRDNNVYFIRLALMMVLVCWYNPAGFSVYGIREKWKALGCEILVTRYVCVCRRFCLDVNPAAIIL